MTSYHMHLESLASVSGVRVRTAPVPPGHWGLYDHSHKLITIKPGLGRMQYNYALAHELGHAHFGHHGHHPKQERIADKWAARQLIDFEDLLEHSKVSMDRLTTAANLGVLPSVLETYIQSCLSPRQSIRLLNHLAEIYA